MNKIVIVNDSFCTDDFTALVLVQEIVRAGRNKDSPPSYHPEVECKYAGHFHLNITCQAEDATDTFHIVDISEG